MAVYVRLECGECGTQVVNNDKAKRYVHAGMVPEREPHLPSNIKSVMMAERAA